MKSLVSKLVVMVGLVGGAAALAGCTCGVAPDSGDPHLDAQGAFVFDDTKVGASETLSISVHETADGTDETITAADITGDDSSAFRVVSRLPIYVPAGQSVDVEIEFSPAREGSFEAQLVLDTEKMGPSPITLEGTGE